MLIQPRVFGDPRGFFLETYHAERYRAAGIATPFVQDNWSRSVKGTLRGMHFQQPQGQGKLFTVVRGNVFDVTVDIRRAFVVCPGIAGLRSGQSGIGQDSPAASGTRPRHRLWREWLEVARPHHLLSR